MTRYISGLFFATLFAILVVGVVAAGCGVEETPEEEEAAGLITLSDMTPDPVPVTLSGDIGIMDFDFSSDPLDMDHAESLRRVLYDGSIEMNVASNNTGVNFGLNEGTGVTGDPAEPGEFMVTADTDGKRVTVKFFNSFEGYKINPSGSYTASVEVLKNNYFTTESFARDVSVEEE